MIESIKAKLPAGVSYTKYINFYCLRSHGSLRGKSYSDQIYVHDKVSYLLRLKDYRFEFVEHVHRVIGIDC